MIVMPFRDVQDTCKKQADLYEKVQKEKKAKRDKQESKSEPIVHHRHS
jgi:hypothetical protein